MRDVEKKKRINKRGTLIGIAGFIGYPIKQLLNSKGKQADNKYLLCQKSGHLMHRSKLAHLAKNKIPKSCFALSAP